MIAYYRHCEEVFVPTKQSLTLFSKQILFEIASPYGLAMTESFLDGINKKAPHFEEPFYRLFS
jgi:hypothetical protein